MFQVVYSLHVFRFPFFLAQDILVYVWRYNFLFTKFEWEGAARCSPYTKATIMTSVAEADVNLNILDGYTDMRGLYLAFEYIRIVFVHLGNKIITKARPNLVCRPKVKSDINIRSLYYFHNHCDIWASCESICSLLNQ
jgi:hypothetical protein